MTEDHRVPRRNGGAEGQSPLPACRRLSLLVLNYRSRSPHTAAAFRSGPHFAPPHHPLVIPSVDTARYDDLSVGNGGPTVSLLRPLRDESFRCRNRKQIFLDASVAGVEDGRPPCRMWRSPALQWCESGREGAGRVAACSRSAPREPGENVHGRWGRPKNAKADRLPAGRQSTL